MRLKHTVNRGLAGNNSRMNCERNSFGGFGGVVVFVWAEYGHEYKC